MSENVLSAVMTVDDLSDQRFSEVQETVRRLEATVLGQDFWRSYQHEHQSPPELWQFLGWNETDKASGVLKDRRGYSDPWVVLINYW